jgi:phosphohistidine phosphatase
MLLYIMRHGPAEDRAATGRDFDRVLTPAGREVVTRVAHALHEGRRPRGRRCRVLTSPFWRAIQTAEIVAAKATPALHVEVHDDLAADAHVPLALVRELVEVGEDALLVGHQPTVEELARELLHPARPPLTGGFRTATVIELELVPPSAWRAVTLIEPGASGAGWPASPAGPLGEKSGKS